MNLGRIISVLCLLLSANSIPVVADAQSPFATKPAEPQADRILSISLVESYGQDHHATGRPFTSFTLRADGVAEEVSGFRAGRTHTPDFYGKFTPSHFERLVALIELYKTIDLAESPNDTEKQLTTATKTDMEAKSVYLRVVRQKGETALHQTLYNPTELRAIENAIRSVAQHVQWTLPRPKFSGLNTSNTAIALERPEEAEKIRSVSLTLTDTSHRPTVLGYHFTRLTLRSDGFAEEVSGLESERIKKIQRRGHFSPVQFERLVALIAMCKATDLPDFQRGAGQVDVNALRLKSGSKGLGVPPDRQAVLSAEGVKGKITLLAADFNASELWMIETAFRGVVAEIQWRKLISEETR